MIQTHATNERTNRIKIKVYLAATPQETRRQDIAVDVQSTINKFKCILCKAQYTTIEQWNEHLNSYQHNHRVRFQETRRLQVSAGTRSCLLVAMVMPLTRLCMNGHTTQYDPKQHIQALRQSHGVKEKEQEQAEKALAAQMAAAQAVDLAREADRAKKKKAEAAASPDEPPTKSNPGGDTAAPAGRPKMTFGGMKFGMSMKYVDRDTRRE